eukprot:3108367-Rhodomonas_salina.5
MEAEPDPHCQQAVWWQVRPPAFSPALWRAFRVQPLCSVSVNPPLAPPAPVWGLTHARSPELCRRQAWAPLSGGASVAIPPRLSVGATTGEVCDPYSSAGRALSYVYPSAGKAPSVVC